MSRGIFIYEIRKSFLLCALFSLSFFITDRTRNIIHQQSVATQIHTVIYDNLYCDF